MEKKILILGSGFMGRAIALALLNLKKIGQISLLSNEKDKLKMAINWIAERDEAKRRVKMKIYLHRLGSEKVKPIFGDVKDRGFKKILKKFDLIIGVLPSFVGLGAMKKVIEAKRDMIDVSAIEEYLKLSGLAKEKNLRIIPDCGLSPGLMNLIIGREKSEFNQIEDIEVKVGSFVFGSKRVPINWCPNDFFAEYFFPARKIENGKIKILKPLKEIKIENLSKVGKVECILIDNLGTLPATIKPKNLRFYNLRPIGHLDWIKKNLNKNLKGKLIKSSPKGKEITAMFIDISGIKSKKLEKARWQIFSEGNEKLNSMQKIVSSMVKSFVKLFFEGKILDKGIILLENLGRNKEIFNFVLKI